MKRILVPIGAALALALGACGGSKQPVEGSTVPTAVPTQTQTQPAQSPVATEIAKLDACLGGKQTTRVDVFEPTYQLARSKGGAGYATRLKGQQVELLVFPDAPTAQLGLRDAQDRLISTQQQDPATYQKIAATAMQVVQNVLEIVPTGAPPPDVNNKIVSCVTAAAAAS